MGRLPAWLRIGFGVAVILIVGFTPAVTVALLAVYGAAWWWKLSKDRKPQPEVEP